MIIDANNLILGRMASYIAKKALLGNRVDVVNCENCVIIGKKREILGRYNKRLQRGVHTKGPFLPKMPDRFVKKTIRGMIPYNISKGKSAFKNVRCYIGVPENLKNEKMENLKGMNISKLDAIDYIRINEVCKFLGGR